MAQADQKLQGIAFTCNRIYIFELFAAAATVFLLRDFLWARKGILFVVNEAACAALTKGAARNGVAHLPFCSLRLVAARYDIAFWTERAPTQVNPADLPFRHWQLSFSAEPCGDLATFGGLLPVCHPSWMLMQFAD